MTAQEAADLVADLDPEQILSMVVRGLHEDHEATKAEVTALRYDVAELKAMVWDKEDIREGDS